MWLPKLCDNSCFHWACFMMLMWRTDMCMYRRKQSKEEIMWYSGISTSARHLQLESDESDDLDVVLISPTSLAIKARLWRPVV